MAPITEEELDKWENLLRNGQLRPDEVGYLATGGSLFKDGPFLRLIAEVRAPITVPAKPEHLAKLNRLLRVVEAVSWDPGDDDNMAYVRLAMDCTEGRAASDLARLVSEIAGCDDGG